MATIALALVTTGCSGTMSNGGGETTDSTRGGAQSGTESASANEIPGSGLTVDRVAFDLLPEFGLGGISYVASPVLLFKGGVACDCLEEDLSTLDLGELRKRRPNALGEWRDQSGTIEIKWSESWRKLGFTRGAEPLGDGWKAEGRYNRLSGVGSAPSPTVVSSATISFAIDGRFRLDSLVAANTGRMSAKDEAHYQGSYEVAGWIMTLRYDDGTVQRYSALKSSGDDADGALWIAGSGYTRQR